MSAFAIQASSDQIAAALEAIPHEALLARAEALTLAERGPLVTYSRKVFVPLTRLCRDVCHYCTFATAPSRVAAPYLTIDEVLDIARAGAAVGCREALFTLGDRPEARHQTARAWLEGNGYASTLDYLRAAAAAVVAETGLLPHLNPGLMEADDLRALRPVAASMGLMLETVSERLSARGGPHFGSPDKHPWRRLAAIAAAGTARVPFTTGLLIGIGETRSERVEALVAIRDLHETHGHIQEVIIQNFVPKPDTRMAAAPGPSLAEHQWTIAAARLVLGGAMSIQAPPNLRPGDLVALLQAGVDDWGGVSPVTPDHVNPEMPWPQLHALADATASAGRVLRERLAIGPRFIREPSKWLDPALAMRVQRAVDARGLPFADGWRAGAGRPPPASPSIVTPIDRRIARTLARAEQGTALSEPEVARLFTAEGGDEAAILNAADAMRAATVGETVTYVVNRNINYTNICLYTCGFCAFSKGSTRGERGPAYALPAEEVAARAIEAVARGATEVCLQGGIHPEYDGRTYVEIVRAVRAAAPTLHIHAFSPLEVTHGAATLGLSLHEFLTELREAGLASLPGTAAEILHDDVRRVICPDKVDTQGWLDVMRAAHDVGLSSTATIMFGHVDNYGHWARHLALLRAQQEASGGFTEFVPLPFVHMEAPLWRKGLARPGPSWRETRLMHAIARLALGPVIPNIQASWVKLGPEGAAEMLAAGANDLGGVLMDESITRAAGGRNGQLCDVDQLRAIAGAVGRPIRQRTTLYSLEAA